MTEGGLCMKNQLVLFSHFGLAVWLSAGWLCGLVPVPVNTGIGRQGSDTRVIRKKPTGQTCQKNLQEPSKEPAPNLIPFQFVMPLIIKDFFIYTAYNYQYVMNLQIFR